jgi:hypothetical protein
MKDTVNQMDNNITRIGQMGTNHIMEGQTYTAIDEFDRQLPEMSQFGLGMLSD